jgi:iron complex outermembrane receptor protein
MAVCAMPAVAGDGGGGDLRNLSLEELMQVVVTSVAKKSQPVGETAAAVFVIQAEDIRRSGATNIPEALRLAPGVQVAALGQNRWSVSMRGFNFRFSNKLLVLVDGRAIYSPAFSGVFWEHNDIPLANVERIEIIRGPGSSLWGANAVNGVINIITYSAKDTQGGLISASVGDEVRGTALARYGWMPDEDTYLHLHAGVRSVDGGRTLAGGDGPDTWKTKQAGFRLDTRRGGDNYSLQGTVSDYRAGDRIAAFTAAPPYASVLDTDGTGRTAHLLGRWESRTATGSQSLQAFVDHVDADIGYARYRSNVLDLEYQRQVTAKGHDVVWGLGYRAMSDRFERMPYTDFANARKSYGLYSVFIEDDIALVPNRWRLTLGSRFEHNDFTGFEMQPNIRLLWTPTAVDSLWAALSRAVRTPARGERNVRIVMAPPRPPNVRLPMAAVGDPNMDSEKLRALDFGWRRQWNPALSSDVAAFYYRYADLRGILPPGPGTAPQSLGGYPVLPMSLTNAIGADSYGLELALDWRPLSDWRLQANTSLFRIKARDPLPGATGGDFKDSTPSHQLSLRSSVDLTPRWQWDLWLRRVGKVASAQLPANAVAAYSSLDMRLAWKVQRQLEVSLVGQNLLNSGHQEIVAVNIASIPIEIQRGIYLKADWRF